MTLHTTNKMGETGPMYMKGWLRCSVAGFEFDSALDHCGPLRFFYDVIVFF